MTFLTMLENPNYWRTRERQVRKRAQETADEERLEILLRLANDYRRLALNAERQLRNEKQELCDYRFTQ